MGIEWLKLNINILNDEKIKLLRKRSDGNELFVMWIGLMCLAMKNDNTGKICLSGGIPYSTDDLALLFELQANTIKAGLNIFQQYGMIEISDGGIIELVNFEKHQNLEKVELYKQKTRERVARYRERKKAHPTSNAYRNVTSKQGGSDVTRYTDKGDLKCNVTVTKCNAEEKDKIRVRIDKDKEKETKKDVASVPTKKPRRGEKFNTLSPEIQNSIKKIYQHVNKLRKFEAGYQYNSNFAVTYLPAKIKNHGVDKIIIMLDYVWVGLRWGENEKMQEYFKPSTLFQYESKFDERIIAAVEWDRKVRMKKEQRDHNEKDYQAYLKRLEQEAILEAKEMYGDKKITREDFLRLKEKIGEPKTPGGTMAATTPSWPP